MTSTSTVGLPRLSKISRPMMSVMAVMDGSDIGNTGLLQDQKSGDNRDENRQRTGKRSRPAAHPGFDPPGVVPVCDAPFPFRLCPCPCLSVGPVQSAPVFLR